MIKIYSCAPSAVNGYQFLAQTKAALLTYLDANYYIGQFNEDKYTLVNGVLRIAETDTLTNVVQCRYVYWERGNDKRFYNVVSGYFANGFYWYTIQLDNWGTYIYDASFSNFTALQATRAAPAAEVKYPTLRETKDVVVNPFGTLRYLDDSMEGFNLDGSIANADVSVIVFITFESSNFLGHMAISTLPFAFSVEDWKNIISEATAYPDRITTLTGAQLLRSITNALAMIEQFQYKNEGVFKWSNAAIANAYVVPSRVISTASKENVIKMRGYEGISQMGGPASAFDIPVKQVISLSNYVTPLEPFPINSIVYFGTRYASMPVESYTRPYLEGVNNVKGIGFIGVRYLLCSNEVRIALVQGNNEMDITSNFKLSLNTETQQQNSLQAINEALQDGLRVVGSIIATAATEGAAAPAAAISIANVGLKAAERMNVKPNAFITEGDALTTFIDPSNTLCNPFLFKIFTDDDYIMNDFQNYGLSQHFEYNGIFDILSPACELLGRYKTIDFVKVEAFIDNLPTEAANEIRGFLSNGMFIKVLY